MSAWFIFFDVDRFHNMRALLSAGRRAAHSALSFTKSPAEVSSSLLPSLKSVVIQQTSVSPTFVGTHPLLNVSEQCIIPINTTASNNTPSALGSLGSVLVLGTIVSMNDKVNDPTRCAGIDGPLTAPDSISEEWDEETIWWKAGKVSLWKGWYCLSTDQRSLRP